jgi:hypothetical protein
MANRFRSAIATTSNARSWVARKRTRGGAAGIQGLSPSCRAKAPAVAGLEPGETKLRDRGDEIVSLLPAELQKFSGDLSADGMRPDILVAGLAGTRAPESGPRGQGAYL